MNVKRFIGRNSREAMQKVKAAFGMMRWSCPPSPLQKVASKFWPWPLTACLPSIPTLLSAPSLKLALSL